jgi:hypothetical protein
MDDGIQKLTDAIDWAEKNFPLPRCRHGKPLKDGAGELLEPSCGCRGFNLDPDFRRDAPESGDYCVRCQRPIADRKKALFVTVHWETWTVIAGGNELIGADCWRTITKEPGR